MAGNNQPAEFQLAGVLLANVLPLGSSVSFTILAIAILVLSLNERLKLVQISTYFLICLYPVLVTIVSLGPLSPQDLYGYAGGVNQIIATAHINPVAVQPNISQWPLSYLLWAMSSTVLGVGSLSVNSLLLVSNVFLMAITFLLIGRRVNQTYGHLIALMGFALTINQYYRIDFFVDTGYAGALTFALLLLLIWRTDGNLSKKRKEFVVLTVLLSAVVFGHLLWALQLVGFILIAAIIVIRTGVSQMKQLSLLSVAILVAQGAYSAFTNAATARYKSFFSHVPSFNFAGFYHGLSVFLSSRTSGIKTGSEEGILLNRILVTESDVVIVIVALVAITGTLYFRRKWKESANWVRLAWAYVGISPIVLFITVASPDPGLLARTPAQVMPVMAIVAATCLLYSAKLRKFLPVFGVLFLMILFFTSISVNPLQNVPQIKFSAESYLYTNSAGSMMTLDKQFIGTEFSYFNPIHSNVQAASESARIEGTFLTVSTNSNLKYNEVVYENTNFSIEFGNVTTPVGL